MESHVSEFNCEQHSVAKLQSHCSMLSRIIILEDDSTTNIIWERFIKALNPRASIDFHPSLSSAILKYGSVDYIQNHFDLIIADIFLSGDGTGIDF